MAAKANNNAEYDRVYYFSETVRPKKHPFHLAKRGYTFLPDSDFRESLSKKANRLQSRVDPHYDPQSGNMYRLFAKVQKGSYIYSFYITLLIQYFINFMEKVIVQFVPHILIIAVSFLSGTDSKRVDKYLNILNDKFVELLQDRKRPTTAADAYGRLCDLYEGRVFENYVWRPPGATCQADYEVVRHGNKVEFAYDNTDVSM